MKKTALRVGANETNDKGLISKIDKHFPGGSDGKESACNEGDPGLICRLGRSPGEGKATHSSILPSAYLSFIYLSLT